MDAQALKKHWREQKLARPASVLCPCHDCATERCTDPTSGVSYSGKLWTPQEYRRHQLENNRKRSARAMLPATSQEQAVSESLFSVFPAERDSFPDSPSDIESSGEESRSDASGDLHRTSYSDPLCLTLRSHHERLSVWKDVVDKLSGTPFVFTEGTLSAGETDCTLDPNTPSAALEYQTFLQECDSLIKKGARSRRARHRLLATAVKKFWEPASEAFESLKLARFHQRKEANAVHVGVTQRFRQWDPVPFICLLLATTLHLIGQLSIPKSAFLLSMLRLVLVAAFNTFSISDSRTAEILNGIPSDVRTAMRRLDIDPYTTAFACCPKCYALYEVPPLGEPPESPLCTYSHFMGRECGRKIFHSDGTQSVPTRPYMYQDLKLWLMRLYSRPDIEQMLDRRIDVDSPVLEMKDIWDGSVLRNFKGADGRHFLDGNEEGRLVFGINQDGANPYGNRTAGKKVSVGPIYLVCLNLPPKVRYRTENIFLAGIIPGPKEPSGAQINHLLRPLVDDLEEAWEHGIFLARTANRILGRRVRCAVLPIIADLPASRQLSGLGSFRSTNWCSECYLPIQDRNNLDKSTWVPRTWHEHSQQVKRWCLSGSQEEQEQEYEAHHVRFSELLRLSYWDPTTFVTIDAMHAFYLGLFQRHIRTIWGMDVGVDDGLDKSSQRSNYVPTALEIQAVCIELQGNPEAKKSLAKIRTSVLVAMCRDNNLRFSGSKRQLFLSLREHYDNFPFPQPVAAESPVGDTDPEISPERLAFETDTRVALTARPIEFLVRMCSQVLPKKSDVNGHKSKSVSALIKLLQDERRRLGLLDEGGRIKPKLGAKGPASPKVPKIRGTVLLGTDVLRQVRDDMKRRPMPSTVGRAPSHPGEATWGKFTADQWKTFCIYHLPYTLTRLWGQYKDSPIEENRRKYDMLQNFLHLVGAVKLATSPTVTAATIEAYEKEIYAYLSGLLLLYPGAQIESYQHLAMHFGDLLKRWGPTRAWRCFAFERYNGLLQKTNTSKKFGEMEATMLKTFCRRQNVTALFSRSILPPTLLEAETAFKQYLFRDVRGTWTSDTHGSALSPEPTFVALKPLEKVAHLSPLLVQWMSQHDPGAHASSHAQFADEVLCPGGRFVIRKHASGKKQKTDPYSSVITSDNRVGLIRSILLHSRTQGVTVKKEVFVKVDCLKELSKDEAKFDRYRDNFYVSGRLVHNSTDRTAVYSLSQISHCVLTMSALNASVKCRHALPIRSDLDIVINSEDVEVANEF